MHIGQPPGRADIEALERIDEGPSGPREERGKQILARRRRVEGS